MRSPRVTRASRSCPRCWRSIDGAKAGEASGRPSTAGNSSTCLVRATKSRRARASRCTRPCATITARARGMRSAVCDRGAAARLDSDATRQALGVAEYFGPRGQILRACDSPTMVKDGSGWGAHVGVTAALLAREGFTGAPALTVERDDADAVLGRPRHALADSRAVLQGVSGVPLGAARDRGGARAAARARLAAEAIAGIEVESFREAVALARVRVPATTEEAQYSLAVSGRRRARVRPRGRRRSERSRRCPIHGCERLGAPSQSGRGSRFLASFPRRAVGAGADRTRRRTHAASRSPSVRVATRKSASDDELRAKYRALPTPVLGAERAARIEQAVRGLTPQRIAGDLDELCSCRTTGATPLHAQYAIVGAGIHGLSTALRSRATPRGRRTTTAWRATACGSQAGRYDGIGAGASGIACGVVRTPITSGYPRQPPARRRSSAICAA